MKLHFKILFIFSFTVFSAKQVVAQKMLSVDEAIAAALNNNYDILLLKNDSTSYALDNSYKNAAFLPRLNATTGILFNNNNQKQKLSDGSTKQQKNVRSNNINASVGLNWTVFDGFDGYSQSAKRKACDVHQDARHGRLYGTTAGRNRRSCRRYF